MFVRALITGAAPSPYIYISGFVYYAIKLSIKLWKMENEVEIVRIRIFEVEEIPEKRNVKESTRLFAGNIEIIKIF